MDNTPSISSNEGKPIRCKAAICRKAGEALVIEEIQVDPPQAYEVRIKILCTSLCHTDVVFRNLDSGPLPKFPRILGHEAVGVVESIGEHVVGFKQGDIVLPVFHPNCEECKDCKSSKTNWCGRFAEDFLSNTRRYGKSSRFKDSLGETIHHFLFVSSFSEYTVVDIAHLVKISHDIPVDRAILLSCGVATGVGAAWKVANVEQGSTVAIFGLGAVGLAVAEGARLRGAAKIIGVDINPDKFEIGKELGLTDFINPTLCGEKTTSEVIKEMSGGGVDYSFECVGSTSLLNEAFLSTRAGSGKTVMLGMGIFGEQISLDCFQLFRGKMICGSLFGGLKPKLDIPTLVDHYLKKELNLDCFFFFFFQPHFNIDWATTGRPNSHVLHIAECVGSGARSRVHWRFLLQRTYLLPLGPSHLCNLDCFVTHELNFEEINKAFDLLEQGKSIRCILWMDK